MINVSDSIDSIHFQKENSDEVFIGEVFSEREHHKREVEYWKNSIQQGLKELQRELLLLNFHLSQIS